MRRTRQESPHIDPLVLRDLVAGDGGRLRSGAALDALRIEDADSTGVDLADLVLDGCEIRGWRADGARLDRARVLETRIHGLTAAALPAKGSVWRDVHLAACRIGAADWIDVELTSVVVSASKIGYLNLGGAAVRDVRFEDCTIDELDLRDATVRRLAFPGCSVRAVHLADARLDALDLRGTGFISVDDVRALAGAVLDEEQVTLLAPLLAASLRIRIR